MSLDKSEQQDLTFRKQGELINNFYLKVEDGNYESQDEDEDEDDSEENESQDEDEDEENDMVTKAPIRHSHQTEARFNGDYNKPSARTQPEKQSKASEIIINGIRNKVPNGVIIKQLVDAYHEGGDLMQTFASQDSLGVTALTIATLSGNWEVAKCLLQILLSVFQDVEKMREYVNKKDVEGNTMVHEMAYMGRKNKVINSLERLLSLRICNISHSQLQNPIFDMKANYDGEYPVHFCMKSPWFCPEAVPVFCNADPSILAVTDSRDNTILHYFLLCLPRICSTFKSCKEAADAVRKTLEFLLSFEAARDYLLLTNRSNRTPEILLEQINNIPDLARTAAIQVFRKQPKPVLLQIPLENVASNIPAVENEPATIPVIENEPSAIQNIQNEGDPLQDADVPADPVDIHHILSDLNLDDLQDTDVPDHLPELVSNVDLHGFDGKSLTSDPDILNDIFKDTCNYN